jgi:hypothetical protein
MVMGMLAEHHKIIRQLTELGITLNVCAHGGAIACACWFQMITISSRGKRRVASSKKQAASCERSAIQATSWAGSVWCGVDRATLKNQDESLETTFYHKRCKLP